MAMAPALVRQSQPTGLHSPAIAFADTPAQAFGRFPFGGLARETARRVETPTHENSKLERIVQAWKQFLKAVDPEEDTLLQVMELSEFTNVYNKALNSIHGISCSASDLEVFVEILSEFQQEKNFGYKAGAFISALVNTGSDRRYVVRTDNLDEIHGLGAYNERDVIVEGKAGKLAGMGMRNGNLTITGSSMPWTGYIMQGGVLTVEGHLEGEFGIKYLVGSHASGGEIHINSPRYETITFAYTCKPSSCKIFICGRQIYLWAGVV